jgi:hypothetical protein
MAITPTYSWPLPDNDDLVKDGAEAIRDLGNAIDTTVDGLGIGLVHIETQSLSAVAAVNFNDVFSSTYKNYKVLFRISPSTSMTLSLRFRAAGTDDSTSNYFRQTSTVADTSFTGLKESSQTSIAFIASFTNRLYGAMDINDPFLADGTGLDAIINHSYNDAAITQRRTNGGQSQATSFDGFSIIASTGTITGRIQVFGYKE